MIVSFATAWGYKHGGLNGFNAEMCKALAALSIDDRVVCCVLSAGPPERRDAEECNVTLIDLDKDSDSPFDKDLANVVGAKLQEQFPEEEVLWWIGHDSKTGPVALKAKAVVGGECALIMHMSYADYASVTGESSDQVREKIDLQRSIFLEADVAFANGPLLRDRLDDILRPKSCKMLFPGLIDFKTNIAKSRLSVVAYGRLDKSEDVIKQGRLTIEAFSKAVHESNQRGGYQDTFWDNPELKIIGIDDPDGAEGDELRQLAEQSAGGAISLRLLPFITDRSELLREISTANQVLVLSWHEGFSLTGWEAISGAIPLTINRKTGLYRLLSEEFGGLATGCVTPVRIQASFGINVGRHYKDEDVIEVQNAVLSVALARNRKQNDAIKLRGLLKQEGFTWERCAVIVADAIGIPIKSQPGEAEKLSIADDVLKLVDEASFRPSARDTLEIAEKLRGIGRYHEALDELDSLDMDQLSKEEKASVYLTHAEISLRLNEYKQCVQYVEKCVRLAAILNTRLQVRAEGVRNVVMRDLGRYDEAVAHAKSIVPLAESTHDEKVVCSTKRKLARSLALVGSQSEATEVALESLEIAKRLELGRDQGNALFALGEAHRHGFQQKSAMLYYTDALSIAAKTGNWDSFIWSSLALADSHLLNGGYDLARHALKYVGRIVQKPASSYGLEKTHWMFSLSILDIVEGNKSKSSISQILREYERFPIYWPEEYSQEIDFGRKPVTPKRF